MLGPAPGGLRDPKRRASSPLPRALGRNEAFNSDRRQSQVERDLPGTQSSGSFGAFRHLDSERVDSVRVSLAPTVHLAACYPVCCRPRPPPRPARPPAQNRRGKEVVSTVSGSPEKLPSSEGAGGIPGAGGESKPGESCRPPPPAAAFCVCHFPESAEHVSCGRHAAGCRGAVGSPWPGPRLPLGPGLQAAGRRLGSGRAVAPILFPHSPSSTPLASALTLGPPARHLA